MVALCCAVLCCAVLCFGKPKKAEAVHTHTRNNHDSERGRWVGGREWGKEERKKKTTAYKFHAKGISEPDSIYPFIHIYINIHPHPQQ